MSQLPQLSGAEIVRALEKAGWEAVRQRGSHVVMTKTGRIESLSIPQHHRVGRGLLRDLIRKAGLTVGEFLNLA